MRPSIQKTSVFPSPVALFSERCLAQGRRLQKKVREWTPQSSRQEIHQIRVLSRRSRASYRILAACLPSQKILPLGKTLAKITQEFSPLRSWDVGLSYLEEIQDPGLEFLQKAFKKRGWKFKKKLKKKLRGKKKLEKSFKRAALELMGEVSEPEIRFFLLEEENKLKTKVRKSWEKFWKSRVIDDLHTTRIAIKKWRYHQEVLQECLGLPSEDLLLKKIKIYQDCLGTLNDWETLRGQLKQAKIKRTLKNKQKKIHYHNLLKTIDRKIERGLEEVQGEGEAWLQPLLEGPSQ